MLNGRGDGMKRYKIDLSMYDGKVQEVVREVVQRKAFELGYKWMSDNMTDVREYGVYLFFNNDCSITYISAEDIRYFESHTNTEISAADFLALTPEDVKDEVIVTTEPADWHLVTQGESRMLVPIGASILNTGSEPMNIEFFTRTVAERFLPKIEGE